MYLSGMGWVDAGCVLVAYSRDQGPTLFNVEMDVRVL
jgi:hypothetical protein